MTPLEYLEQLRDEVRRTGNTDAEKRSGFHRGLGIWVDANSSAAKVLIGYAEALAGASLPDTRRVPEAARVAALPPATIDDLRRSLAATSSMSDPEVMNAAWPGATERGQSPGTSAHSELALLRTSIELLKIHRGDPDAVATIAADLRDRFALRDGNDGGRAQNDVDAPGEEPCR